MRYVRGLFVDRHRSGIQPLRAATGGGHLNGLVGAAQDGKPGVGTDLEVLIGESGFAVEPGGDAAIGQREGSVFLQRAVARIGRQLGLGNPAGIAQQVLRCGLAGDQYLVPVALLPYHKDAVAEEGLRVVEIVRGERLLLGQRHVRQPAANIDRICQGGMVDWTWALRRGPHRGHRNGDISAARLRRPGEVGRVSGYGYCRQPGGQDTGGQNTGKHCSGRGDDHVHRRYRSRAGVSGRRAGTPRRQGCRLRFAFEGVDLLTP